MSFSALAFVRDRCDINNCHNWMMRLFAVQVFTKVDLDPINRKVTFFQLTVKILVHNQLVHFLCGI